MLRCSAEAFAKCPTRHLCGTPHEATFTEGSECDKFNQQVLDKPMTKADRIRAMSDEELANFFFESPEIEFGVCEYCKNFGGHLSDTPCKHDLGRCNISDKNEAFKKWLKQPAEGE